MLILRNRTQRSTIIYHFLLIIIISLWLAFSITFEPGDGLGTDFYPFYRAGEAIRAGESPYSDAVVQDMMRVWKVKFASTGFVYPLPAAIGVWPILLLPLPLATVVWTAIGAAGVFGAVGLAEDWRERVLLPFCFLPVWHAIEMHQATLVWTAFVVVLIVAMRRRSSWLVGLCVVLLPGKPQVGLLFALAGLLWAWREDKRSLLWAAGWGMLIWGVSFALQPTWVQDWIHSLSRHTRLGPVISLLPWSLVILPFTWKLPWYAQIAALQVAIFPASDIYTALPLLLVWIHIGGWIALLGAGVSWLWLLAGMPYTITTFWLVMLLPLMAACLWRWRQYRRDA
ncbi:MAG: hypothetical protein KatS3mg057_0869 [Herpetosiphonaceae bacterium]|nr:MAG: hypothetical protein KatS3mg057_0869 [Herpetosiphonaceae bacterium]